MTGYEIAKANADTAREALEALGEVRSRMLGLVIADKLTSAEFDKINALETQLSKIYDRLNSDPAFGNCDIANFTWDKFLDTMEGETK